MLRLALVGDLVLVRLTARAQEVRRLRVGRADIHVAPQAGQTEEVSERFGRREHVVHIAGELEAEAPVHQDELAVDVGDVAVALDLVQRRQLPAVGLDRVAPVVVSEEEDDRLVVFGARGHFWPHSNQLGNYGF